MRAIEGKLDFDPSAIAGILPANVQNPLTARVDRLAAEDRALLQAAAVIERRFDPQLMSATVGEGAKIDARLTRMQALDLVHHDEKSGEYVFKHALVRDALYQSLLFERRTALHLRIADEIERRSGNRLNEVAEILAHHYGQTDRADKAFTCLAMAGIKSLSVYSLDEGAKHFTAIPPPVLPPLHSPLMICGTFSIVSCSFYKPLISNEIALTMLKANRFSKILWRCF